MNQYKFELCCPIHSDKLIEAICLNKNCQDQKLICFSCLKTYNWHDQHKNELIYTNDFFSLVDKQFFKCQNIKQIIEEKRKNILEKLGSLTEQFFKVFQITNEQIFQLNFTEICNSINKMNKMDDMIINISRQLTPIHDQYLNTIDSIINELTSELNNEQQKVLEQKKEYEELFCKARLLYNQSQYCQAIKILEECLKINNSNVDLLFYMADSLRLNGNQQEAFNWYNKSLQNDPKNIFALLGKSEILKLQHKYKDSIDQYNKVLQIDLKCTQALCGKGEALRMLDKLEASIICFEKALNFDPKYVLALYGKGESLRVLNKLKESFQCLNNALQINPDYHAALISMGATLRQMERHSEALKYLEKAQNLNTAFTEDQKGNQTQQLELV